MTTYKIHVEPNKIHDNLLDIIGRQFNFDHVKGLSEWLKNSVDAYIRASVPDSEQFVYYRFSNDTKGGAVMECIDFNGMEASDIDNAFKNWGDPEASRRGIRNIKVYGGHGNGGKFYMRQMFETSHFITYKNGNLNVFGFNKDRKYGFADGFKDRKMEPAEALKFAELDSLKLPPSVKNKILAGQTGFTVVQGVGPFNMKKVIKVVQICNQLANQPQAQRILGRIPVTVIQDGEVLYPNLTSEKLKPYKGFEDLMPIDIPDKLTYETTTERAEIQMTNQKYPSGHLQLYTSEIALERNSKHGEFNRVDVIGELGVIATYKISELEGAALLPQHVFIYGECVCPILEDPDEVSVIQNDRSKLVETPKTKALLKWVADQVRLLAEEIALKQRSEREQVINDLSSSFNDYLNRWKDKYMSRVLSEVLAGQGAGPGQGTGTGGTGGPGQGTGIGGNGGGKGTGGDTQEGGSSETKKKPRSPRVLLSEVDNDPFPPYHPIVLDPRQGAVYQRPQDVDAGIYWINRSAPLAQSILKRHSKDSLRWRDYLFQRYVDIFIKEALFRLEKQDPDDFNAANVEQIISEVVSRIHEAASSELSSFLFEEEFIPEAG